MAFKFGVDSEGNYGYYKAGADSVTPFRTGNATAAQVLSGYTFANASSPNVTGTMSNNGGTTKSATYSLDTTNSRVVATIPANGYYNTSSKLYATYASIRTLIGLTDAKIVKGNTILGLAGNGASSTGNVFFSRNCRYDHTSGVIETNISFSKNNYDKSRFSLSEDGKSITVKTSDKYTIIMMASMFITGSAGATCYLKKNGNIILGVSSSALTSKDNYQWFFSNGEISLNQNDVLQFFTYSIAWNGSKCGCYEHSFLILF